MATTNPFSSIRRSVEKVYRRLACQSLLKALCISLAIFGMCVLTALLAFGIREPSEDLFYGTVGLILAMTSACFFIVLAVSLRKCASLPQAAEFWETKQPELKEVNRLGLLRENVG